MSATATDSDLFSSASKHIPGELRYNETTYRRAIGGRRDIVKLTSNVASPSPSSQNKFNFTIPNFGLFRPGSSYLSFEASTSAPGAGFTRFSDGIHTIFERLRITWGSLVVEDIEDVNLLTSMYYRMGASQDWKDSVGIKYGFGTTGQRNTAATTARYSIPLFSDFLKFSKDIPVGEVEVPLRIELTLAPAADCLESDQVNPTYTLTDVKLVVEMIDVDQSVAGQLSQQVKTNSIHIPYRSFARYTENLTGISNQVKINSSHTNVKYLLSVMRVQANLSVATTIGKFDVYAFNGLTSVQSRINGRLHPQEAIECRGGASELYQELLKVTKTGLLTHDYTSFAAANLYGSSQSVIGLLMEAFESSGGLVSGQDTSKNSANLELHLNFSGAPAATQLDTFVAFDSVIKLSGGRVERVF